MEQKNNFNPNGGQQLQAASNILIPSSPFFPVAKVRYRNLLVKIFSDSLDNNSPRQFFFEPLVLLDPKIIVSGSYESSKQNFIQITIQMWNEEIRSKVLERLRSLKNLKNVEIEEEDICVMPFEEVLLVAKSGSLPNSISLTDKPRSYLRSNEKLDFCLLCDSSSSAQALAHDLRLNTETTLNEWQLELECRGLSSNSGTAPAGLKRPTFLFNISTERNDEIISKLSIPFNTFYFFVYLYLLYISELPASLSAGCSSIAAIAPAVSADSNCPASSSGNTEQVTTESPTSLKQLETEASASRPIKEEKVNVAQLKLAVQQPSSSNQKSMLVSLSYFVLI